MSVPDADLDSETIVGSNADLNGVPPQSDGVQNHGAQENKDPSTYEAAGLSKEAHTKEAHLDGNKRGVIETKPNGPIEESAPDEQAAQAHH